MTEPETHEVTAYYDNLRVTREGGNSRRWTARAGADSRRTRGWKPGSTWTSTWPRCRGSGMSAPTLTAEDTRRDELKTLARAWHETGRFEVRQMRLEDLAHPSLRGWALEEAFDALQGDLALLDGLNCEVWAVECQLGRRGREPGRP